MRDVVDVFHEGTVTIEVRAISVQVLKEMVVLVTNLLDTGLEDRVLS